MQATTPACRQAGSLICKGLRTIQRAATVEFAHRRRKRSLKIESASLAALRACSNVRRYALQHLKGANDPKISHE
jgi:hypothetical protein